jgi:WD40 repeat protein
VKVRSLSGGKEVASLAGHSNYVCSVAVSPDGQYIVSGSDDNLVKVWSVSGGKEVVSLAGHAVTVYSVAFSADGLFEILSFSYLLFHFVYCRKPDLRLFAIIFKKFFWNI